MGVERVDYYSDNEYRQALQQEEQKQDPDIVPCFICGSQMYWELPEPIDNICENCMKTVVEVKLKEK